MKVFVVFGSVSDENVSLPLVEDLKKHMYVEYAVISAHRDLEKLREKISTIRVDAIIAGAGLAAALPGVVAAMTSLPVFGVPVASQFCGLDSFASIAQMPPGVPVLTCGPDKTDSVVSFLSQWKTAEANRSVHFIVPPEMNAEEDIAKAEKAALDRGLRVTTSSALRSDSFNVRCVRDERDIKIDEFCLHVPLLSKEDTSDPQKYLQVLNWSRLGGIWVGVNNTRNAVHAAARLIQQRGVIDVAA